MHLLRSFGLLRWATNFTYLKEIWSPSYVLLYIFAVLNELKNGFSSAQKFDVLYTYLFQALVKLFLDLHEKHNVGLINAEVRMEDVTSTIELLVTNLSECSALLELQPQFKRQLDSFDKVGWEIE